MDLFVFVEEFELADLPLEGAAVIEGDAVEAVARGGVKGDFVMQLAGGVDYLRRLTERCQVLPSSEPETVQVTCWLSGSWA